MRKEIRPTMDKKPHVTAIILAAGSGSRMGVDVTKQRINILGESLLRRSVSAFSSCDKITDIVVVCRADELEWARSETKGISKLFALIPGGKTRAESAKIGFNSTPSDTEYVAIHDGARCLVTPEIISKVVDAALEKGAATAGSMLTDTVKRIDAGMINKTIPRESLFAAHTPQIFKRDLDERALENSSSDEQITDDNMLLELLGVRVCPVDTGNENIKITKAEDIALAEYILKRRGEMSEFRCGHGYDVHRLVAGRKLILGGVEIPHTLGLLGHSDADVLTHAIIDALLGACGLGDIGRHFPDTDDSYKGISSLQLLSEVASLIVERGFAVVNIDATLVIQKPKIAGYINCMTENISEILKIEQGRVNIKATTEEGLGFTGREEGVAAHAVVTVKK